MSCSGEKATELAPPLLRFNFLTSSPVSAFHKWMLSEDPDAINLPQGDKEIESIIPCSSNADCVSSTLHEASQIRVALTLPDTKRVPPGSMQLRILHPHK